MTLNSKSGVVFSGSYPIHKTYGIVPGREVALGFASKLRREALVGAAQRRKNFGGNDACGGALLGFTLAKFDLLVLCLDCVFCGD